MDHAFGIVSEKSLPCLRSSRFPLMLYSRSFIVLCCKFRSMTHLQFIFVNLVQSMSRLLYFGVDIQLSQHHLLKRLSLPSLLFCQRSDGYIYVGFFPCSVVCFIVLSVLSLKPHYFDDYSFLVSFEVG